MTPSSWISGKRENGEISGLLKRNRVFNPIVRLRIGCLPNLCLFKPDLKLLVLKLQKVLNQAPSIHLNGAEGEPQNNRSSVHGLGLRSFHIALKERTNTFFLEGASANLPTLRQPCSRAVLDLDLTVRPRWKELPNRSTEKPHPTDPRSTGSTAAKTPLTGRPPWASRVLWLWAWPWEHLAKAASD